MSVNEYKLFMGGTLTIFKIISKFYHWVEMTPGDLSPYHDHQEYILFMAEDLSHFKDIT